MELNEKYLNNIINIMHKYEIFEHFFYDYLGREYKITPESFQGRVVFEDKYEFYPTDIMKLCEDFKNYLLNNENIDKSIEIFKSKIDDSYLSICKLNDYRIIY